MRETPFASKNPEREGCLARLRPNGWANRAIWLTHSATLVTPEFSLRSLVFSIAGGEKMATLKKVP
jgi:hypothetical protein